MTRNNHGTVFDLESDPFGERTPVLATKQLHLLGGRFQFESNSRELLRLVESAYAGLPRHRLATHMPDFRIKLLVTPARKGHGSRQPPRVSMLQGAGLVGCTTDSSNFVVISPGERAGLVAVSPEMLRFRYHTRYELIEFAVFTLAARAQRLVSLHAACVGEGGRGILLMGASGAGKSTAALLALLSGFDFLSEDSVFVTPKTLLATGIANFLHVRADSLCWLGRSPAAAAIAKAPVIQRRSGVRKFEFDLRNSGFRLAQSPLKIAAVVFLSPQHAGSGPLLRSLPKSELIANLTTMQAYAAGQPQWRAFIAQLPGLGAFELRRGRHPLDAVEAFRTLLAKR